MKTTAGVALLALFAASSANAQTRTIARDRRSLSASYGSHVVLVEPDGRETAGTLTRIDEGDFVVTTAGRSVRVAGGRVSVMLAADHGSVAGSMLKWALVYGAAGDLLVNQCVDNCSARQDVMSAAMVIAGALYGRAEALRHRRQRRQLYVAPGSENAAWPDLIAPADELPGTALLKHMRPGDFVFVTDARGSESAGSVKSIDETSIVLDGRGGAVRRFRAGEVMDVQRLHRDPDWDGLLFGAMFGTVSGLVIGDTCDNPGVGTCRADGWDTSARGRASGAVWQACVYGGIGYLLDRSSKRERIETLYRVKPPRARRVDAAPSFGRGRTGLRVRVSF